MKKQNIRKVLKKNGYIIYNFKGTSMLPLLKEKEDKVHLKTNEKINLYDVVLFERSEGYFVLHRVIDIVDGKCYILGDNSPVLDVVPLNEIVAKMVGYYKKDKYYDINDESYLRYVENLRSQIEPIKKDLIKDHKAFYFDRKKQAYYEVLKYTLNRKANYDVINSLLAFEKSELVDYCAYRKILPSLCLMVSDKVVNLGEALNAYALKELNEAKFRYLQSEEAVKKLTQSFSAHKIPHIFLKGSDIRKKYLVPYLRVSHDIDLLVKPEDFEKAKKILIDEFAGEYYATTQHDESYISKALKMDVEIHHHINTDLPEDVMWVSEDLFKDAIKDEDSEYRYHASNEMNLIVNLSHAAKHLNGGEFWGTMLIDFYILSKQEVNKKILEDARLTKFNETLTHLTAHIFDFKSLSDEEKEFEKFLFKNRYDTYIALTKGKYKTKFAYLMNRIFVPYRYFAPTSKALQKCPLLLPFFEVKRWFSILFRKGSFKRYKTEVNDYMEKSKNEIKALTNVGLSEYIVKYEDHKKRF